jgi:hypothetical protein
LAYDRFHVSGPLAKLNIMEVGLCGGKGCSPHGNLERGKGRSPEQDTAPKSTSAVTHFPQLSTVVLYAKVSRTSQNSTTIWRQSPQHTSLWGAFLIQIVKERIIKIKPLKSGATSKELIIITCFAM